LVKKTSRRTWVVEEGLVREVVVLLRNPVEACRPVEAGRRLDGGDWGGDDMAGVEGI
jgi:hypothetical protein